MSNFFISILRYLFTFHVERFTSFEVHSRRRFKFVRSTNDEDNTVDLFLCQECAIHLTLETSKANMKIYNSATNTWPGFVWSIFIDVSLMDKYNTRLWQMIPQTWRYWWIDSARICFTADISLHMPQSIFVDKTVEINEWDSDIESMELSRLRNTSNKHLMPCVLCPWGCSEFLHQ